MDACTRREALHRIAGSTLLIASPSAHAAGATMQSWPLATPRRTGIHDVAPAPDGGVWFTAQRSGEVEVQAAPRGAGPYGICTAPNGDVWWCSLAGSFIARLDRKTGESTIVEPPTARQGARRIWADRQGTLWVSEWNSGHLSAY